MNFASISDGIKEFKKGNMLVVLDDPNRENQADLIFPAETVTTEKINFMIQQCRGFVCAPITKEQATRLHIPLMVSPADNTEKTGLNFGVTVDAKNVTAFGISASDRALTIQQLCNQNSQPSDFMKPGHVFPLVAVDGGILERDGHTEATIDLVKRAGFYPAGVLCEILNNQGQVADLSELTVFAKKFGLKIVTIPDLKKFVNKFPLPKPAKQPSIVKISEAMLPTKYGLFTIMIYKSVLDQKEHVALILGKTYKTHMLTRIHSQCFTGDTLSSLLCDCREQLHESMKQISKKGSGIILYLNQEGRGIGLANKIKAYALQRKKIDTVAANQALGFLPDERNYIVASDILHDIKISSVLLMTNNPVKIEHLRNAGIEIIKRIPLETLPTVYNKKYLQTKKQKLRHLLTRV